MIIKLIKFLMFLSVAILFANDNNFPAITILGSANVHGEIEPCG